MRKRQHHHTRTGLYAGVAITALLATPVLAQAQAQSAAAPELIAQADQPAPPTTSASGSTKVEELVITGIRKSQIDAIKLKRQNADIVEAISAEDIGKLPDESIADSIARLPGLAAQRNNGGRTQDIAVNGLPPSMSTTLLNGFLQASTDNNRTTQFDQYPAEMINQVLVYKTGDAALIGAGIATVDMRTVRPLDYGHTTLAVSATGEYDTRGSLQPEADAAGYRANVTYITQLADDKLGVMFGYSHQLSPNQIYIQHPYNWVDDTPGGLQDQVRSDNLTRDGFNATVQWKPNDHLEVTVDGFNSTYDDNQLIRGVEFSYGGTPNNGGASSATVSPQIEDDDRDEKAHLRSADITAVYKFGNGWKLHGDYGYSEATRDSTRVEIDSGLGLNGQTNTSTATLTETGSPGIAQLSNWSENLQNVALGENLGWSNYIPSIWPGACIGGTALAAPSWGAPCPGGVNPDAVGGTGFLEKIHSEDSIQQTHWYLSKDLTAGPINHVEVGASYSIRKKDYIDYQAALYLPSGDVSEPVPSAWLLGPTNLSVFGLPDMFSINPFTALGSLGQAEDIRGQNEDWWVSEKVFTPYVAANINTQLGGHSLTGNIGSQFVYTDQAVTSVNQSGNGPAYTYTPYTGTTKYWEILPSLNLTWHLNDNQDLRFGAGRSMARPRFDQMGGNSAINTDVNFGKDNNKYPFSGSVGNPGLKPWISDDVDVTYERYFAPGEGVAIEGFYKNLESFVYDATGTFDFSSYYAVNPVAFPVKPTAAQLIGPVTEYLNGNGGSMEGIVLSGNYNFKHLSPILDGFGISANVTWIDSHVVIPDPGTSPDGRIPELSKYSGNVSFFYEKNGISLRINDRYRSKYDQEVPNFNGTLQPIIGASENIVDFQASYKVQSGRLKNLTFTFSAENLTDAPMNSYSGSQTTTGAPIAPSPKYSQYYQEFGTNVLFGVSYKY